MEHVGNLQTEKADRSNCPRGNRNDRRCIGYRRNRSFESPCAEQWIQQRARRKRQALVIVQMHQHDTQQTAQHGPREKAPVQEGLCECRDAARIGLAGHPVERRRVDEMHQRLGGCPESTAAGQQCAHDDHHPVERRIGRFLRDATEFHASQLRKRDAETDREGGEHQKLPVQPESPCGPAENRVHCRG